MTGPKRPVWGCPPFGRACRDDRTEYTPDPHSVTVSDAYQTVRRTAQRTDESVADVRQHGATGRYNLPKLRTLSVGEAEAYLNRVIGDTSGNARRTNTEMILSNNAPQPGGHQRQDARQRYRRSTKD